MWQIIDELSLVSLYNRILTCHHRFRQRIIEAVKLLVLGLSPSIEAHGCKYNDE